MLSKMNKIFDHPSLGRNRSTKFYFFQSFQALLRCIPTSSSDAPPEIVRKNIEIGRKSFIEWKAKADPKNPQILVLQAPSWHLKTSQRTAR